MLTGKADTLHQGGRMQIDVGMQTGKADTWHQGDRMQTLVKMLTGKADILHLILVKMVTCKVDT